MIVRGVILFFSFFFCCIVYSQDTGYVTNYSVGETNILIHSQRFGGSQPAVTFINLHDNEQTSLLAAQTYLVACGGGNLVHIKNEQERFVNVCVYGNPYRFDPNRIYSDEGRKYTLTKLSFACNDTVATAVEYLADQILNCYVNRSKLIVAIHNNTDSLLSVFSYQQDQADKKHFGRVFINPDMDPDDFMLTPDSSLFRKIMEKNINVVWENTRLMSDDGSLSIYAGQHKIPYINIEAQHDHSWEQLNMLNALDDIIKSYGKRTIIKRPRSSIYGYKQSPVKAKVYK